MTSTRPQFPIEIGDLVARLADCAPQLARDLLPAGVRRGSEWCVAAADSPFGCSTSVHLAGNKAGIWGAWAASKGGDALELIAAIKCDGGKGEAIRWALDWLRIDPRERDQVAELRGAKNARSKATDEPNDEAKRNAAFRLWLAAAPLAPGSAAYDYLANTRGIDFAALGGVPRALRSFGALTNTEAGRPFPALIAAVFRRSRFLTIHRTWLERQSNGRVLKAPVAEPKKVFGPYKGGLIPLTRGASNLFIDRRLSPELFAGLTQDDRLFGDLAELAASSYRGRRFLRRVIRSMMDANSAGYAERIQLIEELVD